MQLLTSKSDLHGFLKICKKVKEHVDDMKKRGCLWRAVVVSIDVLVLCNAERGKSFVLFVQHSEISEVLWLAML